MRQTRAVNLPALIACALLMEVAFVLVYFARNPGQQVKLLLWSYLISGLAFAWLLWTVRNADDRKSSRWTIAVVIAAAIVFRLTLLPLNPAASQDVQRYLWEGLVQLHGFNPYVLPPTAPPLAPLAHEYNAVWASVNHPDVAAIYPPVAQLLFLGNAAVFGGSLLGWKLILFAFDGLLAAAVWALLRQRSGAMIGLAGVLWCPLLLLETYEGGHLDLIGVALIVLALATLSRGRWIPAAIALALAINVKYLWPLLVLIVCARQAAQQRRGIAFVFVAAAVAAVCWLPYRSGLTEAMATAKMFAESWTFNDVIFEYLRKLPGPRWLPMAVVLGVVLAAAVVLARRARQDIWSDAWLLSGTALLLGPVAYPWYFMWIVPGLALRPPLWLAIWVLAVPALHVVDWHYVTTGLWDPMPWLWLIVGTVPAALLVNGWRKRFRRPDYHERESCLTE